MKTDELREKYLEFYESKGHRRVGSDVLVPTWDPSVLFTPAGMNQFKDHFLGKVKLDFTRATTSQKCLRTGDIDNVGRTAYHHTFFEMLGNFSFGDYFKREAISWAWEFLTGKKWLGLDPKSLTVSVYTDDDEAADIWHDEIGLPTSRIARLGEDDNFWPAGAPSGGPDGVCGPCSEIFYHDGDSEVEIWNLVFTQFNRVGDPPDNLRALPSKNIDTGMGLERTAAVLQGEETNYHIDILKPIVEAAAEITSRQYVADSDDGRRLRRITDHVRACTFAVHENVYPGPNKEKYVVRRLLRRAVLDGHQMGLRDPFLHQLVPNVAEIMRPAYPELSDTVDRVSQVIRQEENAFFGTIDDGLARIEKIFSDMTSSGAVMVDGDQAADLYKTFGVPPELVESMAADRQWTFDWKGYEQAMDRHGIDSGKGQIELFKTGPIEQLKRVIKDGCEFLGYDTTEESAVVQGIVAEDDLHDQLTGDASSVILVLDRSPFYGESGGQVGDSGTISSDTFTVEVSDTTRDGDLILHHGTLVNGEVKAGQTVTASVDVQRRDGIRRAHSATHILHHALQDNLGSHAQQQGSKVDFDELRFDFTNLEPVAGSVLAKIESDVSDRVAAEDKISWDYLPLAEARSAGAMMLFGEKYPDPVRMVSMGEFSKELCGGTHLQNTSEVGNFEIISEEGVSAGTRRIIALTGGRASEYAAKTTESVDQIASTLKCDRNSVAVQVNALSQQVRDLKKQLSAGQAGGKTEVAVAEAAPDQTDKMLLRDVARTLNVAAFDAPNRVQALVGDVDSLQKQVESMAQSDQVSADSLLESSEKVGDVSVVTSEVPGGNPNLLRQWIDQIRKKASPAAVLLITSQGDKVVIVAGISKELVDAGKSAGAWIGDVAKVVGGGGGGRPDMAQAGGKLPDKIPDAVALAKEKAAELFSA